MTNAKALIGRKAAKAVVKHSAHGTVSKVRRDPARASTLVGVGAAAGAAIGFAAGRKTASAPASPTPPSVPSDPAAMGMPVGSGPAV